VSSSTGREHRSTRGRGVLVVLLLAAAAGASAVPTWVTASGVSALAGAAAVRVSGSTAAPVVPATALVLAAAGAAIALAGRVGRWVVAAVVLAGGAALVTAAAVVLADPAAPAADAVRAQTGVDHLVGPAVATVVPWFTLTLGVITVLVAVLLARWSGTWSAPSRRHERAAGSGTTPTPDERSDWDALTRGADPSEGP
jgi:uncharacterized membrane protein (TIGR02234 family)